MKTNQRIFKLIGSIIWCLCYVNIHIESIKINRLLFHPTLIGYNFCWELYFAYTGNKWYLRLLWFSWFIFDAYFVVPLVINPGYYSGYIQLDMTCFLLGLVITYLSIRMLKYRDAKYFSWFIDSLIGINLYYEDLTLNTLLYKFFGDMFWAKACLKSDLHLYHQLNIIFCIIVDLFVIVYTF